MAHGYGVGATLASIGQGVEKQGLEEYRVAADEEQKRNAENTMIRANEKAGNAQLGGTIGGLAGGAYAGATWGSAAGPWGTLIGGIAGALLGDSFG